MKNAGKTRNARTSGCGPDRPASNTPGRGVRADLRQEVLKIDQFAEAMQNLCNSREMGQLLQAILDGLVDGLGFDRAAIWMMNGRQSHLHMVCNRGGKRPLPHYLPLHGPDQDPTLTWVLKKSQQVTFPVDPLPAPRFFKRLEDQPISYALLPLRLPASPRRRRFRDGARGSNSRPPNGILLVEPMNFVGQLLLDAFLRTAELLAENISSHQNLVELSRRDGLTGLCNRLETMNRLRKLAWRARRSHNLGILFVDLDHFKRVNDTFGHEMGDRVLQIVARTIERSIREEDMVGRVGGDELLVIIPQTDAKRIEVVADRVCRCVADIDFSSLAPDLNVTLSVGGALFPAQARTCRKLLRLADEALYEAKEKGRNRTVVYRA